MSDAVHPTQERIDYKAVINFFNDETQGVFGKVIYPISKNRKESIRARINDYGKEFQRIIMIANTFWIMTAMPFLFQPIEKTVFTTQKWTFFSTASYNSFNIAGLGGGIFYKNKGVHYRYLWHTRTRENGHEFGVNIMFWCTKSRTSIHQFPIRVSLMRIFVA